MRKRCLVAGIAAVCLTAAITPSPAQALQLIENGFSTSAIERSDIRYEIEHINPSNAEISLQGASLTTDDAGRLMVATEFCQPGEREVKGSAVYTWRSCGTDADDDRIDVHMTLRDITVMNPYSDVRDASILLLGEGFGVYDRPKQGGASLQATVLRPDADGDLTEDPETRLGVSAEVELNITKANTDTPASGRFIFSLRGLNGVDTEMPAWSERIDLVDGFSNPVLALPENTLVAEQENTSYTAGGGDEDSYSGGFATVSDPGKTVFRWTGRGCRQLILDNFSPARVTVKTNGHGSVTCEGSDVASMWPVEWTSEATFSFVPDTGYRIPLFTMNGISLGEASGWTYSNAIMDILLELEFQPYEYQIEYDSASSDATGSIPKQAARGDQTVTIQDCAFAREGYVFSGWNTKRNGGGTAYHPGQQVVNLAVRHNQTIRLYAQWEPVITVRVPTEALCRVQADGTVVPPSEWQIANLSRVAVKATAIEASDAIPGVGIMLSNMVNQPYFQLEPDGVAKPMSNVATLKPEASVAYVWSLRSDTTPWGKLSGEALRRILQQEGTAGVVTFAFERA